MIRRVRSSLKKIVIFIIFCSFLFPFEAGAWWEAGPRARSAEDSGVSIKDVMPKILVLFEVEKKDIVQDHPASDRDSTASAICESVIRSRFSEAGFSFIDHTALMDNIGTKEAYTDEHAAHTGKSMDAELVIVCKILEKCEGNIGGTVMKAYRAAITGRVIRTDEEVVIASVSAYGSATDTDDPSGMAEAIEKAAEQLSDILLPQVIDRWRGGERRTTTTVIMTVHGIKSCSDLARFRAALAKQLRGVINIYPKMIESKTVRLDLEMKGEDVSSLADKLAEKHFGGFSVEITDVGRNSIELRLSNIFNQPE